MNYADIPHVAKANEVAILLFYDPARDNKKEAAFLAHCSIRTVQRIIQKYEVHMRSVGVTSGALLVFSIEKQTYISR